MPETSEKCACDLIQLSIDDLERSLLGNGRKQKTVDIYKRHWYGFAEFLDNERILYIDELTTSHVDRYLSSKAISQIQRNQAISAIKALLYFFDDQDIEISNLSKIDRRVKCKAPKRRPMPVLTQKQLNLARDMVPVLFPSRSDQARNGLIFDMLFETMIRTGELSDIRLIDINVERMLLDVRGKGADLDANGIPMVTRQVPLSASLLSSVEDYLRNWRIKQSGEPVRPRLETLHEFDIHDHLFTSTRGPMMSERNIYRVISGLTKGAKIQENRGGHLLRRSAATIAHSTRRMTLREIQVRLGHSDINTTMIYLNVELT